jgi:hypothetical protein
MMEAAAIGFQFAYRINNEVQQDDVMNGLSCRQEQLQNRIRKPAMVLLLKNQ